VRDLCAKFMRRKNFMSCYCHVCSSTLRTFYIWKCLTDLLYLALASIVRAQGKRQIIPAHTLKICRGNRGTTSLIFNLGTRWKWVVSFMTRPFYLRRRSPWWPLKVGGWVGPRSSLYVLEKRKISCPCLCNYTCWMNLNVVHIGEGK